MLYVYIYGTAQRQLRTRSHLFLEQRVPLGQVSSIDSLASTALPTQYSVVHEHSTRKSQVNLLYLLIEHEYSSRVPRVLHNWGNKHLSGRGALYELSLW